MKLIFEGRKDKIATLKKLNETWSKRNDVTIIEENKKVIVPLFDEDAELNKLIAEEEAKKDAPIRKRRTKAEIEADKK